jgi:hypothetical protein
LSPPNDDRRYPKRPIVGVGALIFKRDRILMAQRGKEPLKHRQIAFPSRARKQAVSPHPESL